MNKQRPRKSSVFKGELTVEAVPSAPLGAQPQLSSPGCFPAVLVGAASLSLPSLVSASSGLCPSHPTANPWLRFVPADRDCIFHGTEWHRWKAKGYFIFLMAYWFSSMNLLLYTLLLMYGHFYHWASIWEQKMLHRVLLTSAGRVNILGQISQNSPPCQKKHLSVVAQPLY